MFVPYYIVSTVFAYASSKTEYNRVFLVRSLGREHLREQGKVDT